MLSLNFYTTSNCHLCELANELLAKLEAPLQLISIDIAHNDQLIELYGLRIPVLKRLDNSNELHWPFTLNDLIAFTHMPSMNNVSS